MATDDVVAVIDFSPDKRHSLRVDALERDGDDLHFDVRVRVHRFAAHTAATATVGALRSWGAALQQLHDELAGEALLEADGMMLRLVGDGRGHVA